MNTLIDLSTPISTEAIAPTKVKIKRVNHKKAVTLLGLETIVSRKGFKNKLRALVAYILGIKKLSGKDFPDNEGLAWETVTTMTHRGTHMDAPYHFGSMVENKKAKTIEEIPLEWCFGDGVLLDFSHKKPTELISKEDVIYELERINYTLKPFDIVLIKTGCGKLWNKPEYLTQYPGLAVEGLEYILDKGIKVIGIDSYSLDRPSFVMADDFYKNQKNPGYLWPTHFIGRKKEYSHIEQLNNLDKIPMAHGFKVCCFPVLIEKASAGWCRVVAIF